MTTLRLLTMTFAITLLSSASARALPDLRPEIYDVTVGVRGVDFEDYEEGCAGGTEARRLIEFSLRTYNDGDTDLFLGDPGCPNCTTFPGAVCDNPLFVCGTSHGHAHFELFAKTDLLDADMNVVAEGGKYGFCLLDEECGSPKYSCSYQGISAGCSDVYEAGLPCQYIDITEALLPHGQYTLRVTIDPNHFFPESDKTNNSIDVPVTIGKTEPICSEYESADVPKSIPDLGSASSELTLPDLGPVTSIRVRMAGRHDLLGELRATLAAPSSTEVAVMDQVCEEEAGFSVYLGDEATADIFCPAIDPSTLRWPSESLAPFIGEQASGTWTLTMDDVAAGETGTLDSWSLEVCSICGNANLDDGEACDDGNVLDGDCCSSDCQTAATDGTPCDDRDACTTGGSCDAGACGSSEPLECDPCLICDHRDGCVVPDLIYPCQHPPSRRSLLMINRDESSPARDSFVWKWRSQTPVELNELGAPETSTDLTLCVYDADRLVLSSTIPAASRCADRSCWDATSATTIFGDRDASFDGMTLLRAREGRTGRIVVRGSGVGIGAPDLPLSAPTTVRLIRNDGTPCWEAGFSEPGYNSATRFKARSD